MVTGCSRVPPISECGSIDDEELQEFHWHIMTNRFFMENLPSTGMANLEGLEAHHLIHVMRTSAGEIVELFNGAGLVARAEVLKVSRRDASLKIIDSQMFSDSTREVILGTAVPKGDRFDWLIEKVTELGVTRLVPLITARSVVDPRDSKLDKLRQTIISACKQSRRHHLLELDAVTRWDDFVKHQMAGRPSYIADPRHDSQPLGSNQLVGKSSVVFAIGPEGGFTDDEVDQAINAGAMAISLGPLILRIETAAVVLASFALESSFSLQ